MGQDTSLVAAACLAGVGCFCVASSQRGRARLLLPAACFPSCSSSVFSLGGKRKGGGTATIGLFQCPTSSVQATSGGDRARSGAGLARGVARRLCLSLLRVPSTSDLPSTSQSLCPWPPRCLTHLLQAVCEGFVRAPGGFPQQGAGGAAGDGLGAVPSTGPAAQTRCPEPSSGGNERPFSSSRGSGAFGFSCKHFSISGEREAVSQGWEQPLVVSSPLAGSSRRGLGPGGRSSAADQLLPSCGVSCVPKARLRSCFLKQKSTAVLFPSRGQV